MWMTKSAMLVKTAKTHTHKFEPTERPIGSRALYGAGVGLASLGGAGVGSAVLGGPLILSGALKDMRMEDQILRNAKGVEGMRKAKKIIESAPMPKRVNVGLALAALGSIGGGLTAGYFARKYMKSPGEKQKPIPTALASLFPLLSPVIGAAAYKGPGFD